MEIWCEDVKWKVFTMGYSAVSSSDCITRNG